jgi:hypothetical protein
MQKLSVVLTLTGLLLIACDGQKAPAEAAFAQIQASVAPASADLEKYAPEQYAQLTAKIDEMKSKLNTKDYAGALAIKDQVMAQLVAASGAAANHKNALMHKLSGEWQGLVATVPTLLGQLGSRVSSMQSAAKLPANVTAGAVQQAKQSVADLNTEWTLAIEAMKSRDMETAVNKAHAIEKRAAEISTMLGLKAG